MSRGGIEGGVEGTSVVEKTEEETERSGGGHVERGCRGIKRRRVGQMANSRYSCRSSIPIVRRRHAVVLQDSLACRAQLRLKDHVLTDFVTRASKQQRVVRSRPLACLQDNARN